MDDSWAEAVAGKLIQVTRPPLRGGGPSVRRSEASSGAQLAHWFGRKRSYLLISLGSTAFTVWMFLGTAPLRSGFHAIVFIQGLVATLSFGWLAVYLPELFPLRVRATAADWPTTLDASRPPQESSSPECCSRHSEAATHTSALRVPSTTRSGLSRFGSRRTQVARCRPNRQCHPQDRFDGLSGGRSPIFPPEKSQRRQQNRPETRSKLCTLCLLCCLHDGTR